MTRCLLCFLNISIQQSFQGQRSRGNHMRLLVVRLFGIRLIDRNQLFLCCCCNLEGGFLVWGLGGLLHGTYGGILRLRGVVEGIGWFRFHWVFSSERCIRITLHFMHIPLWGRWSRLFRLDLAVGWYEGVWFFWVSTLLCSPDWHHLSLLFSFFLISL
jgi:hypothetical protein